MTKIAKKDVLEYQTPRWNPRDPEDKAFLRKFVQTRPKDVPLTDEEIQAEVNMARYGNKYGRNWV